MLSRRLQQQDHDKGIGIGFLILVVLLLVLIIIYIRRSVSRSEDSPFFKVWLNRLQPPSDPPEPLPLPNNGSTSSSPTRIQEVALLADPNLILAPEFRSMHKHKCEMDSKIARERRTEILNCFEKHQVQRVRI